MFLRFGGFNILALPVVRPKYAVHHGRKLTSLVSSPLDLHTCDEIHKHYILKNYRNFRPIIRGLSDFQRQKMIVAGNLPVRII